MAPETLKKVSGPTPGVVTLKVAQSYHPEGGAQRFPIAHFGPPDAQSGLQGGSGALPQTREMCIISPVKWVKRVWAISPKTANLISPIVCSTANQKPMMAILAYMQGNPT